MIHLFFKKVLNLIRWRELKRWIAYHRRYKPQQKKYLKIKQKLKDKLYQGEKLKVVFIGFLFGGNIDVFSSLYKEFNNNENFLVTIVIAPYCYDTKEGMIKKIDSAECYLKSLGVNFIKGYDQKTDTYFNVAVNIAPDIVFFESNYNWNHPNFSIKSFPLSLTFFIPYSYILANNVTHHFSQEMNNLVYKIYPPSIKEIEMFNKFSYFKGANICQKFLGYSKVQPLITINDTTKDPWKIKDRSIKRIIWAPHHLWADYSNFLEYKDFMFELAEQYKEKVQICFKPHPSLEDSLVCLKKWTKHDVMVYYENWGKKSNTQSEYLEWIDLFLTSDAMILDSISFMAEYSLVKKPACVLGRKNHLSKREVLFNECGEEIYNLLYHAFHKKDLIRFIEDIVISENDFKAEERNAYMKKYYIYEDQDSSRAIFTDILSDIQN